MLRNVWGEYDADLARALSGARAGETPARDLAQMATTAAALDHALLRIDDLITYAGRQTDVGSEKIRQSYVTALWLINQSEIGIGSERPEPPGWVDPPEWAPVVERAIRTGRRRKRGMSADRPQDRPENGPTDGPRDRPENRPRDNTPSPSPSPSPSPPRGEGR